MLPRNYLAALIISVALASVTACSGSAGGTPESATSGSPAASGSSPDASKTAAPKVEQPINNTSGVQANPCSAVSTSTIESFASKVKDSRTDNSNLGNTCAWIFENSGGNVAAGLVTANKQGLSSLYAQNANGGLTTFKPQPPILGYPAVVYANGGESEGFCSLAVGIRDDLTYTVITQLRHDSPVYSDSCTLATKIASAAIKHMKGQ